MKALLLTLLLSSCVATFPPLAPCTHSAETEFWRLADLLAERLPAGRDVYVGLVDLPPSLFGLTQQMPLSGAAVISVDAEQDVNGLLDTLVHEWAHAMVLDANDGDHGELWGVAFSRAYRVKLELFAQHQKEKDPQRRRAAGPSELGCGDRAQSEMSANSAVPVE